MMSWQVDRSKFKLSLPTGDLVFEDPDNGIPFWENTFKSLDSMSVFAPSKDKIVKIGLPGSNDDSVAQHFSAASVSDYVLHMHTYINQ